MKGPSVRAAPSHGPSSRGSAPASGVWFVIAQVAAGLIVGAVDRNLGRR
jgi:hypothetical protein